MYHKLVVNKYEDVQELIAHTGRNKDELSIEANLIEKLNSQTSECSSIIGLCKTIKVRKVTNEPNSTLNHIIMAEDTDYTEFYHNNIETNKLNIVYSSTEINNNEMAQEPSAYIRTMSKKSTIDEIVSVLKEKLNQENDNNVESATNSKKVEECNFLDHHLRNVHKNNKAIVRNKKILEAILSKKRYEFIKLSQNGSQNVKNTDTHDTSYSAHPEMPIRNYVLYCEVCERTFPAIRKLLKHYKHHKNKKGYRCFYCALPFGDFQKAMRHWLNDCPWIEKAQELISKYEFLCISCNKTNREEIHIHRCDSLDKSTQRIVYTIKIDQNQANRSSAIQIEEFHSMLCDFCGKVIENQDDVESHISQHASMLTS